MPACRDFHSRPLRVDSTAATILVGFMFAAMALLALAYPRSVQALDGKPLVAVPSTAVLPLNAGQRHLNVTG